MNAVRKHPVILRKKDQSDTTRAENLIICGKKQ
jgi:hypothetical protein